MSSAKPSRSAGLSDLAGQLALRYVPIARWLPGYPRGWLRADALAALTSWAVMVPIALAYAGLAGVPPELGLVTAFTAMTMYAIFGTSRHLKVTVSSSMAIMSASVVAGLAPATSADYLVLTAGLALAVGLMLLVAGFARLGFISDFLAKPVVTGFIFGLAISIIIGQLPKILGVPGLSGSLPEQVVQLVEEIPDTNPYTLAVGLTSLVVILVLRRISRRIPGSLLVLVAGIIAGGASPLAEHGVSLVGAVATGVSLPSLPLVPPSAIPSLVVGAAGIVFLAVGESVGTARAYAARHQYELDTDQELIALGAANVGSALMGGFTTDASLSQTATAEAAGVLTQVASLITAVLVLATAVFLAPLFRTLPEAVLGAIVIAAVLSLMDARELRRYLAWRRTDFGLAMTAMVGVLLSTVLVGMGVAVLLSVVSMLYRASRPYVAEIGKMPGSHAGYADLSRHPEAEQIPGLVMIRLDAPLYFFNANVARSQILEVVAASDPPPHAVLVDLGATSDLDVTTTDIFVGLVRDLHAREIEVLLAQVKGSVRDRMRRTGLMNEVGEDRIYLSVGAAAADYRHRWGQASNGNRGSNGSRGPNGGRGPSADPGAEPVVPVESA